MRRLPAGPSFAPLQTALFVRDPYGFYAGCQRRYGDPFFVAAMFGSGVMTGDPEAVRTILSAPPETFVPLTDSLVPLVGKKSVFLADAEQHKAQRKLLMPPMTGSRLRAYGRLMREVATLVASRWPTAQPFAMLHEMQEITLLIILRAIFGVTEQARVERFRDAIHDKTRSFTTSLWALKVLHREFGGVGPWAKFQRASRRVDDLLYEEMDRRRTEERYGDDVLSLLLNARYDDERRIDDEEIRDHLLTLLIAGHETTSVTLSWALYWLHRHPVKLERVRAEIEALGPSPEPDAVAHLPYLDAVCNESLRLNPITPSLGRRLAQDFDLKGYCVPKGMLVSACTSLIHASEDLYPDPSAFEPDRFLLRSYAAHEFLPFGGGVRRCLGAAFASYEMKQVLAAVLPIYRLKLSSNLPERAVLRGTVMGPERSVTMRLLERRAVDPS